MVVCDVLALISIHAPREGSDAHSHPGHRRRSPAITSHAPREGSDSSGPPASTASTISIHAPREGSDFINGLSRRFYFDFYPRSPRGERRLPGVLCFRAEEFLSTLPARGATDFSVDSYADIVISIHAPREGSDLTKYTASAVSSSFLSTLPARGATWRTSLRLSTLLYFYPRSPRGERPRGRRTPRHKPYISIHAPRVGSDSRRMLTWRSW